MKNKTIEINGKMYECVPDADLDYDTCCMCAFITDIDGCSCENNDCVEGDFYYKLIPDPISTT